jgi:hypothetical protein
MAIKRINNFSAKHINYLAAPTVSADTTAAPHINSKSDCLQAIDKDSVEKKVVSRILIEKVKVYLITKI